MLKPQAILSQKTFGSQTAIVSAQISDEKTALLDAEIARLEAEAEMEFEIPDEFTYPDSGSEDFELLSERFEDVVNVEEVEKKRAEDEEKREAALKVEEFWSIRKKTATPPPINIIPKQDKTLPAEVEEAAQAVSLYIISLLRFLPRF